LLLPPYDPAIAKTSDTATTLISALRRASGVIISSPGYHGSISGMIKNALDYVEEMRTDEKPYFEGKVVGCIICANGAQTMGTSLTTLRSVVHALRGWPTPYAATLETNALTSAIEAETWLPRLKLVAEQVTAFANSDMSVFHKQHNVWPAAK
jgi:FMN reductase